MQLLLKIEYNTRKVLAPKAPVKFSKKRR